MLRWCVNHASERLCTQLVCAVVRAGYPGMEGHHWVCQVSDGQAGEIPFDTFHPEEMVKLVGFDVNVCILLWHETCVRTAFQPVHAWT